MTRIAATLLLLTVAALCQAQPLSPQALLRCRDIKASEARLACYDAIDAMAVPAVTPPPANSATTAPRAESFGFDKRPADQLDVIETRIAGVFDGWRPKQQIPLVNGQVWRINEDSTVASRVLHEPQARLRRGALGGYLLEVEGVTASPRVVRIK